MTKNNDVAAKKGCEATVKLLQTQVYAYEVEKGEKPDTLDDLVNEYVEKTTCPDGSKPNYNKNSGKVTYGESTP